MQSWRRACRAGRELAEQAELAELAQRIIRVVGGGGSSGRIFEIDTRLRPDGERGELVPSIGRFETYVRSHAATWERLALTKLRTVAGDADLGASVEEIVHSVLYHAPPEGGLTGEILEMRARIEASSTPDVLKTGSGGLVDIDFLTTALRLLHGHEHVALRTPSTLGALAAARDAKLLSPSIFERVLSTFQILQRVEARLRIGGHRSPHRLPSDPAELNALARRLGYLGTRGDAGTVLTEEIGYFRGEMRAIFVDLIGDPKPGPGGDSA